MSTIALAITTAPDIETARQLHDYGALDDAGVVAALEQTGLLRDEAQRWPGHLTRLQQVAVVIDTAGDLTLAAFDAATLTQEHGLLQSLFAVLPDASASRCVTWQDSDGRLLLQRAYHHRLPAPQALRDGRQMPLSTLFSASATHSDVVRLYGADLPAGAAIAPALRSAVHCYVLDLRRRCVDGELDCGSADERVVRVIKRAAQTADEAAS